MSYYNNNDHYRPPVGAPPPQGYPPKYEGVYPPPPSSYTPPQYAYPPPAPPSYTPPRPSTPQYAPPSAPSRPQQGEQHITCLEACLATLCCCCLLDAIV